ncbi:biotin--[acetyl-CoA-carboxylase] ligase [Sphingomonas alba]|uniref:biotin--[acetyl-CoA-carboxylase] ligase n=1 Tax=Sphingomonas alba TaxID=2908208 RepID=UPI0032AE9266
MVERTGSTNSDLLADIGAIEGDWLVALAQDAGKGRQGREWQSLEGNFFGSTLIRLRSSDPPAPSLALAAGLALIEAVDTAAEGRDLALKWPNDLMSRDAKLAGILLERSGERVVAGFGVNLAMAPQIEGRATADLGGAVAPKAFAPLLAASFARMLDAWRSAEPDAFARAWLARAHPLGTPLKVHLNGDAYVSGTFAGIEPDGALRLDVGGEIQLIRAGDVHLR